MSHSHESINVDKRMSRQASQESLHSQRSGYTANQSTNDGMTKSRSSTMPPTYELIQARVLYDFVSENSGELSCTSCSFLITQVMQGDIVTITDNIDDNWSSGENSRNGQRGIFPSTYVEFAFLLYKLILERLLDLSLLFLLELTLKL